MTCASNAKQGDEVRATAIRRIVSESSTGSTDSKRIRMLLTVRVKKLVYSAAGSEEVNTTSVVQEDAYGLRSTGSTAAASTLHVSGTVSCESDVVKLGAYHTLDLEAGRDFTLIKQEGGWDSVGIDRIKEATEEGRGAEVGAIVCGEGTAPCFFLPRLRSLTSIRFRHSEYLPVDTTHNARSTKN